MEGVSSFYSSKTDSVPLSTTFFCELSLSSGAMQHIPVRVLKNMMPDPEHEHLGSDDREYEWMKMCCILHLILVLSSMKLDKSKLWSFR